MLGFAQGLNREFVGVWIINILLAVTWISLLAIGSSRFLFRRSTSRHSLLLFTLSLILVSPALLAYWQSLGHGAIQIPFRARIEATQNEKLSESEALSMLNIEDIDEDGIKDGSAVIGTSVVVNSDVTDKEWDGISRAAISFEFEMPPRDVSDDQNATTVLPVHNDTIDPISQGAFLPRLLLFVPAAAIVWAFGFAVLSLRFLQGCYRLRRIVKSSQPITDPALIDAFESAARSIGLKHLPTFAISDRVSGPISLGLLHHSIILPSAITTEITKTELTAILVHELAHIARRDPWVVAWQHFVGNVFWIHPLVRVMNRQLAQAREEICDNYVLKTTDSATYSRTLLKLATLLKPQSSLVGAVALFNARWKLEHRVAGLLDNSRRRDTSESLDRLTTSYVVASVLVGIAFFGTVSFTRDNRIGAIAKDHPAEAGTAIPNTRQVTTPTTASTTDSLITLKLTVRMQDGTPVSNAKVTSVTEWLSQIQTEYTDESGRVAIRDVFGQGASIHASTADGNFQATLRVEPADIRSAFAQPVELKLLPAVDHQVTVTAGKKPVEGAFIMATSERYQITATSDSEGVARLKLPADDRLKEISAWHETLGVAGTWLGVENQPESPSAVSLLPTAPVAIRVVDTERNPIPNFELNVSGLVLQKRREGNMRYVIVSRGTPGSRLKTNERGEAILSWAPREELSYVTIHGVNSEWQIDEVDQQREKQGVVTVHARRAKLVHGKLKMPNGASPDGLLIMGYGFGPGHHGNSPHMRPRHDGTFEFYAPSHYGFLLGVLDHEWVSEPWTGIVFKSIDDQQNEIVLKTRPATPITIQVTHGVQDEPLAGASVDFSQLRQVPFLDNSGQKQRGVASIGGWLTTGADGYVRGGISEGKAQIRVAYQNIQEEKTVTIKEGQPIAVEFQLILPQKRTVAVRMIQEGSAFSPSAEVKAYAWSNKLPQVATIHRVILRDDHSIEVSLDDQNLCLLVIDRGTGMSGYLTLIGESTTADIVMRPMATYSGLVVDDAGNPFPDLPLRLTVEGSFLDVIEPTSTDSEGRFLFKGIPSNTPLRVFVKTEGEQLSNYTVFEQVTLEPAEIRANPKLQAHKRATNAR